MTTTPQGPATSSPGITSPTAPGQGAGAAPTVLAVYAAAGTLLVLAAAAWRQHRPAGPTAAGQPA
jgi:hypothetical protein